MLTRRHIRVKVMQSLYAYFSSKEEDTVFAEKNMLKSFQEVLDLNLAIISLLIQIVFHAEDFLKELKNKHFPTQEDLNPNKRFINNNIIKTILDNDSLVSETKKFVYLWNNNDHDIIRKLFKDIYQSEIYQKYINDTDLSINVDKKFIINILNECILKNKIVHHILEEKSICWIDDLPFVATIIMGNIKSDVFTFSNIIFKEESDKEFTVELFQNTISCSEEYNQIIIKFARDWDLERIALIDQILLKMAFTEILKMEELPVKVSMNEYIEISKYYGTEKSKLFINGLLDNAVKDFKINGKIKKSGRGLL